MAALVKKKGGIKPPMSSMSQAYVILGLFAVVAWFMDIQWLFYSMLLLVGVLFAADSMHYGEPQGHHVKKEAHVVEHKRSNFMDTLLAGLIVDKHRSAVEAHRQHKEHEKHEKEHAEHVEHREHELAGTKKHLEVQLAELEGKISQNVKSGNEKVAKELKEQRGMLKKKLDDIIQRL